MSVCGGGAGVLFCLVSQLRTWYKVGHSLSLNQCPCPHKPLVPSIRHSCKAGLSSTLDRGSILLSFKQVSKIFLMLTCKLPEG
jgi:hypothetical protein